MALQDILEAKTGMSYKTTRLWDCLSFKYLIIKKLNVEEVYRYDNISSLIFEVTTWDEYNEGMM